MTRQWIEYRQQWGVHPSAPPAARLSWFADAGNARNPRPHVRLTMPIVENVSSCPYWMPYEEGDQEPGLPKETMREVT